QRGVPRAFHFLGRKPEAPPARLRPGPRTDRRPEAQEFRRRRKIQRGPGLLGGTPPLRGRHVRAYRADDRLPLRRAEPRILKPAPPSRPRDLPGHPSAPMLEVPPARSPRMNPIATEPDTAPANILDEQPVVRVERDGVEYVLLGTA